ncbi:hypothetical protein K9N68_34410 (plasmid) [Kovacikia minuta CCNUW1]|uniref:hypothetical protein n=1 Tax=Kovacikia minuta TaxID=2931930 RepID=UPI001CC92A23|nr:hypothetical protein [Kovacikia minuta]UBF30309.1 hypothetical protein K9N68_34410 [Kovacikia minuta CCNUW1]
MHDRFSMFGLLTLLLGLGVVASAQLSLAQTKSPPTSESTETQDAPLPPLPANCKPLPLVGGEGSQVTKSASVPGVRIPLPGPAPSVGVRNNWNTDWFVPSGHAFKKYRITFMPHNDAEYSVNMTLKYPDNTIDQFFRERGKRFPANQPLIIETSPRTNLQPYQVNTNIGGLQTVGSRYTVGVAGCL